MNVGTLPATERGAIAATLGALAARLSPELAERVRSSLPPPLSLELSGPRFMGALDVAELYAHVGELENVDPQTAAVDARMACHAIADALPADVVKEMQRDLGPEIGRLFDEHARQSGLPHSVNEGFQKKPSSVLVMLGLAVTVIALLVGVAMMFRPL